MVAGDAESYEAFARVFEPALAIFHGCSLVVPHPLDLMPATAVGGAFDALQHYVAAVRVCGARNLIDLPMPPSCSFDERREVERILVYALLGLPRDACGSYFPLAPSCSYPPKFGGMTATETEQLRTEGLLLLEPRSTAVLAAGVGRDWPDARGVFMDGDRGIAAWINGEEHLLLIATRSDGDLKVALTNFYNAEQEVSLALQRSGHAFARNDRLGFLTAWPERLGTGLSVNIKLRVPKLAVRADLPELCAGYGLKMVVNTNKETVEVSNRSTLGISEATLVNAVIDACTKLVREEEKTPENK